MAPTLVTKRVSWLDGVRGLAALTVVAVHLTTCLIRASDWYGVAGLAGLLAVSVFFLLSGMVLASALNHVNYLTFLARRGLRLLPPCLVVLFLLTPVFGIQEILSEALFWRSGHVLNYRADPPLWTLSLEIRAALLWPLLASLARAQDRLGFVFGCLAAFALLSLVIDPTDVGWLGLFVVGTRVGTEGCTQVTPRWVRAVFEATCFQRLGQVSFSLYVVHMPAMAFCEVLFSPYALLATFVSIPVATVLLYLGVERPCHAASRRVRFEFLPLDGHPERV